MKIPIAILVSMMLAASALAAGVVNVITLRQTVDETIPAAAVETFVRQQLVEIADSPANLTLAVTADGGLRVTGTYSATKEVDLSTFRTIRTILDETGY